MALPPNRYQSPSTKYPFIGPNYKKHGGEVTGYIYNPYTDKYSPDPKVQRPMEEDQGLIEKTPSLTDQLKVPAAMAIGGEVVKEGGKEIIPGLKSGVSGLLGLGADSAPAAIDTSGLMAAGGASSLSGVGGAGSALGAGAGGLSGGANIGTMGSYGTSTSGGAGLLSAGAGDVGAGMEAGGGAATEGAMVGAQSVEGLGAGAAGADAAGVAAADSAAAGAGASSLGTYAIPGVGAAMGAYGVYQATKAQNKKTGVATGAMSGAAMGASIGSVVPVVGTAIGAVIGAVVGGLAGASAHESTKHSTQRNFGKLSKESEDSAWQQMVGNAENLSLSQDDPDYHFNDKKKAGTLAPSDVRQSYGVLQTFGPAAANLTDGQLQALINDDQFNSRHGDIHITDPEKAKEIVSGVQ